jgi:hypothetical protein
MSSSRPIKWIVAGVAAVALAGGAYAVGNSSSGNGSSGTANANPAGQGVRGGQPPQNGRVPPGFGAPATGAAADKAKAAALARYKGTAERVLKAPDGSYVVHVLTSSGEYHVNVSKDFKVTGAQQGGPGPGGAPGAGRAPGTTPQTQ